MIVGGLASRVAGEVLRGRAAQLRVLTPHFVDYVLAFYVSRQPDPRAADIASLDAETPPEYTEERRKQAGA